MHTKGVQAEYELSFGMTRGKMLCLIFAGCTTHLVFSSFKIGNLFSVKDPIPRGLRTGMEYKGVFT